MLLGLAALVVVASIAGPPIVRVLGLALGIGIAVSLLYVVAAVVLLVVVVQLGRGVVDGMRGES